MIYEFIKTRLQTIQLLNGQVYPTGACIDGLDGAFAVYTLKKRTQIKDLSSELHHYVEEIVVDFVGEMYDELHELYCSAEAVLDVSNFDTGNGEYIFSVSCDSTDPDSFDLDNALLRRSMLVTIFWCPL